MLFVRFLTPVSDSLVLGRTWVSPLTAQIAPTPYRRRHVDSDGLERGEIWDCTGIACRHKRYPEATVNTIAQAPAFRPRADLNFIKKADESMLAAEDQNVPPMMMAMAPAPTIKGLAITSPAPSEIISSILSGNIVFSVAGRKPTSPLFRDIDGDVLIFDVATGTFKTGGDGGDIAFH